MGARITLVHWRCPASGWPGYWLNFAKYGDPNGPGLPEWPRFTPDGRLIQVLDHDVRTEPAGIFNDRCEFWDEYSQEHTSVLDSLGESIK